MTKSAAHESVHPGIVKTAMIDSPVFKAAEEAVTAQMPQGRIQLPGDKHVGDYRLEPCPQESVSRNGEQLLRSRHKIKPL